MTQIPYQDHDQTSPTPIPLWRTLLAWLVILASAAAMIGVTQYRYKEAAAQTTGPSESRILELTVGTKFTLGARSLLQGTPNANPTIQQLQQVSAELEQAATAPTEKLRLAVARGEFQDDQAANKMLDEVAPSLPTGPPHEDLEALRTIYSKGVEALTAAQKARLVERYGWFGHLALAHNQPAENPDRALVISSAKRTFFSSTISVVILGIVLAAGLVLLIVALILFADGKLRRAYRPPSFRAITFLEAFAIYIGGFLAISVVLHAMSASLSKHMVIYYLALLIPPAAGVFWPLWCGAPRDYWRAGLGWHAGRGAIREMALGWVGYLTGFPIIAVGFWIAMSLTKLAKAQPTHPAIQELMGSRADLIMVFILACVYAPLVEETMFRGALFNYLRSGHGWLLSACTTSLIFAAIHPQGWTMIPALFGIAMVLAGIREWRGTILASAAAHALNNGAVMALAVMVIR